MSLALLYYLITIVGGLSTSFLTLLVTFGGAWVILAIFLVSHWDHRDDGEYKFCFKVFRRLTAPLIILTIFYIATPNKKDMIIISGLHLGEKGISKVVEESSEFYPLLKDIVKKELKEYTKSEEE